jgi:hypothetical protein
LAQSLRLEKVTCNTVGEIKYTKEPHLANRPPVCDLCLNLRKINDCQSIEESRELGKGVDKLGKDTESLQRLTCLTPMAVIHS